MLTLCDPQVAFQEKHWKVFVSASNSVTQQGRQTSWVLHWYMNNSGGMKNVLWSKTFTFHLILVKRHVKVRRHPGPQHWWPSVQRILETGLSSLHFSLFTCSQTHFQFQFLSLVTSTYVHRYKAAASTTSCGAVQLLLISSSSWWWCAEVIPLETTFPLVFLR